MTAAVILAYTMVMILCVCRRQVTRGGLAVPFASSLARNLRFYGQQRMEAK